MSDVIGQLITEFGPGLFALPLWLAGAAAALAVGACLLIFMRAGRDGIVGMGFRVLLVVIGAAIAWVALNGPFRRDLAAERRALDARASDLTKNALLPGSALACLDGYAGEAVEVACEKALFASPEATAAATAYVAAQLALLADGASYAGHAEQKYPDSLTGLRHAAEIDRFGIVAQVLAVRDSCTPESCRFLDLLNDASRVRTNLSERAYDSYIIRYSAQWSAGNAATASATVPGVPTASTGKTPPGNLFFPSSESIPPVSIMTAEPPATQASAAADPAAKPSAPPRRPAQAAQPARRPVDINSSATRAPAPAAPAATEQ